MVYIFTSGVSQVSIPSSAVFHQFIQAEQTDPLKWNAVFNMINNVQCDETITLSFYIEADESYDNRFILFVINDSMITKHTLYWTQRYQIPMDSVECYLQWKHPVDGKKLCIFNTAYAKNEISFATYETIKKDLLEFDEWNESGDENEPVGMWINIHDKELDMTLSRGDTLEVQLAKIIAQIQCAIK
jgi:hypothetical protein